MWIAPVTVPGWICLLAEDTSVSVPAGNKSTVKVESFPDFHLFHLKSGMAFSVLKKLNHVLQTQPEKT